MTLEIPRLNKTVGQPTQPTKEPRKPEEYLGNGIMDNLVGFLKQNSGFFAGLAGGLFTGNYIQYNQAKKAQLPYEISIPGFLSAGLAALGTLPIGRDVVTGLKYEVQQGVDAINALVAKEKEMNLKLSKLDAELTSKTVELQKKARELSNLYNEADKLRFEIEMLKNQISESTPEILEKVE